MPKSTASLVVYQTPAADLEHLFRSLQQSRTAWVLVDNSADQGQEANARQHAAETHGGIYLAAPSNVGFGAAHNLALEHLRKAAIDSTYHLVVNPDIEFQPAVLDRLTAVLDAQPQVGWVMPQVRFPNGEIQHLCKLLPTPMDLLGRRFFPRLVSRFMRRRENEYELRGGENTPSTTVPFLSGCFVYARRDLLLRAGGFDESYFMYMEDVDLCRRFVKHGALLYWPEVCVTHGYHRGSHHELRLVLMHIRSAIRYFNRWGWFFDHGRRAANQRALRTLQSARTQLAE